MSLKAEPSDSAPKALKVNSRALCVETQGRDIMAVLVNEIVAEAMRLDLRGAQKETARRAREVSDRG